MRAHLREVPPALKAGKFDKARKSFKAFDDNWDSIEDLIKARSADAYVAIEKGMIEIEQALMPEKPDVAKATALVNDVMTPVQRHRGRDRERSARSPTSASTSDRSTVQGAVHGSATRAPIRSGCCASGSSACSCSASSAP